MATTAHIARLTHDALAIRGGLRAAGVTSFVQRSLEEVLEKEGCVLDTDCGVMTRLKSTESIRDKMMRKQDKYKTAGDMTDYLGSKLVVRDEQEVYEYMQLLKSRYEALEDSRTLYNDPKHVCNMLKTDFMVEGHRVEVQVQTAFDYYVHELEHNLVYKNPRKTFSFSERNMFIQSIKSLVNEYYSGDIKKIRMEPDERVLNRVIKLVDDYIDKRIPPRMNWRGQAI